jgi:hypothetical protein
MFPGKLYGFVNDEWIRHDYGNVYFEQPCGNSRRLVIGPSTDHVDLMVELAAELEGNPWYVLYVLLIPRQGGPGPGRYQSEPFENHAYLASFLLGFRAFFESDGRHHVWVGSGANDGVVVYDQHNVLFAYGPLDRFRSILASHGFRQSEFWFPSPHAHSYMPENDPEVERLMAEAEWKHFPLQPCDEWD